MTQVHQVRHQFVDHIPSPLEDGVVYISIEFGTVIHKCCCGCGDKVVTPLTPVDWAVIYDGQSISLYPSIGRWDAPCRSHYWIRNNRVLWSNQWSDDMVDTLKKRETGLRAHHFGLGQELPTSGGESASGEQVPNRRGWFERVGNFFRRWWHNL